MFKTVQQVSRTLKRVYKAPALNIAIQDGVAAGQSVPHVHAHIIPRHEQDMDGRGGGDKLYEELEGRPGDIGAQLREEEESSQHRRPNFPKTEEGGRKPRSMEVMQEEAAWLSAEMEKDLAVEGHL
jgi:bis(5'-adenosyl)-triphosphatase